VTMVRGRRPHSFARLLNQVKTVQVRLNCLIKFGRTTNAVK